MIPDALRATIYDWYINRHVADDDNFILFFRRSLMRYYPKYDALMRVEAGIDTYDWLVEKYEEEKATHAGTTDKDTSRAYEDSETYTDTKTPARTKTIEKTRQLEHGQTTTRTDNLTQTGEYSGNTSGATGSGGISETSSKNAPMSISNGFIPGANGVSADNTSLSFQGTMLTEMAYATGISIGAQNSQTKTQGANSGSDETHSTGTVTTANTGTDTQTETETHTDGGTEQESRTQTKNAEETGGTTETVNGENLRVASGRYTRMSALLRDAEDFITTTDAWGFLSGKLERCFMGIYDV